MAYIKRIFNYIEKLSKKQKIIGGIILLIIIIAYFLLFSGDNKEQNTLFTVKKGNVIQEVSLTGKVKQAESVNLSFEKGGKVSKINVKVGDKVKTGDLLVSLENSESIAQLAQVRATLQYQQAKLNELKIGTRPEELAIQDSKYASAKSSLEEAKKNVVNFIKDSYVKSDDAIGNYADKLFTNPKTYTPSFNIYFFDGTNVVTLNINDYNLRVKINSERVIIGEKLKTWKGSIDILTTESDLDTYFNEAQDNLDYIRSFLGDLALGADSFGLTTPSYQAYIDTARTSVSTARTNVNTAISNVSSAKEKFKTAESNFLITNNELILKRAGATKEQIDAQDAQVAQARANVLNYEAQLNKTILYSPIDGIIGRQEAELGELMLANTVVVSVIGGSDFEIEANVPEADIAKVKLNDLAKVTLDAYGSDIFFDAKVISIDASETIIEGVANYKTKLQFINEDNRFKSGMTANIDIVTAKRENVILVPQRAVANRNGEKIVEVISENNILELKVEAGLRGSDGNIEIISGLKEGDQVVVF